MHLLHELLQLVGIASLQQLLEAGRLQFEFGSLGHRSAVSSRAYSSRRIGSQRVSHDSAPVKRSTSSSWRRNIAEP
jgi:hypothetical protein